MNKLLFVTGFLAATFIFVACRRSSQKSWLNLLPTFVKDSTYLFEGSNYSEEKVLLGRHLFYDRRLSVNKTKACSSCHAPENSFTDGYARSIGAFGDLHQRNSRPLINLIFNRYLMAADSTVHFPEQQIHHPLFNIAPIEMGWKGNEEMILARLRGDKKYRELFSSAYPNTKQIGAAELQEAISCFIKTIFSFNSPYDRYQFNDDKNALTTDEKNGQELFFSVLHCDNCHGGINFATPSPALQLENGFFYNTGLYNLDSNGSYPRGDQGLHELTKNDRDRGKFRVPTLRNLAFTAPYFHDGSASTLTEVLRVYEAGGREAPASDGRLNPNKHPLIKGFGLNSLQRRELTAFLLSLSDSSILTNPQYANPFKDDETRNTAP